MTLSDEFTHSGAAIHHIAILVIDGLGDRHDFALMMLDNDSGRSRIHP